MAKIADSPPWWGYSKQHGWVVLDRTLPSNTSGLVTDFFFCRCSDSVTFLDKRSRWVAPHYIYASIYIAALPPSESAAAAAEYAQLKARWPEFQAQIGQQYEAREAARLQMDRERVLLENSKKTAKAKKPARVAAPAPAPEQ